MTTPRRCAAGRVQLAALILQGDKAMLETLRLTRPNRSFRRRRYVPRPHLQMPLSELPMALLNLWAVEYEPAQQVDAHRFPVPIHLRVLFFPVLLLSI